MPERSTSTDSYRYAYNGMEMDDEVSGNGNSYTTEFRQYDARLGRWKSLDPLMAKYPQMSPYVSFNNNPVYFVDPDGREGQDWVRGGEGYADNVWHWEEGITTPEEAEKAGYLDYSDGVTNNIYTPIWGSGTLTLKPAGKFSLELADPEPATELESVTIKANKIDKNVSTFKRKSFWLPIGKDEHEFFVDAPSGLETDVNQIDLGKDSKDPSFDKDQGGLIDDENRIIIPDLVQELADLLPSSPEEYDYFSVYHESRTVTHQPFRPTLELVEWDSIIITIDRIGVRKNKYKPDYDTIIQVDKAYYYGKGNNGKLDSTTFYRD